MHRCLRASPLHTRARSCSAGRSSSVVAIVWAVRVARPTMNHVMTVVAANYARNVTDCLQNHHMAHCAWQCCFPVACLGGASACSTPAMPSISAGCHFGGTRLLAHMHMVASRWPLQAGGSNGNGNKENGHQNEDRGDNKDGHGGKGNGNPTGTFRAQ